APVSHGVEPHDFETGQPRRLRNCTITNLAASRRPYRESGLVQRLFADHPDLVGDHLILNH
ncbi:hypothetical protein, partial [Rhodoblastus sp.]|uniref:hypothetical protein n=1 Tax=Rhodoblastus sp. TaxID=1962975 RepID=UPI003F978556